MNLDLIAKQGGQHLAALIKEADTEIKDALQACIDEADAQEAEAKLKLRFTITLNLDKQIALYSLSFGITRKLESAAQMPNPNQQELQLETIEE